MAAVADSWLTFDGALLAAPRRGAPRMTTAMPDKIPLDMPPGDPDAIDDLVRSVAGAAPS